MIVHSIIFNHLKITLLIFICTRFKRTSLRPDIHCFPLFSPLFPSFPLISPHLPSFSPLFPISLTASLYSQTSPTPLRTNTSPSRTASCQPSTAGILLQPQTTYLTGTHSPRVKLTKIIYCFSYEPLCPNPIFHSYESLFSNPIFHSSSSQNDTKAQLDLMSDCVSDSTIER